MGKPDKKRPKGPPDEVFNTPLFKMERTGRSIQISTSRTPEEQARLIKSVVDNRPKLLVRANEIRAELKSLIHKYTSLDLLAQLIARDVLYNPDKYKEYDSELAPHLVEHLALLELEDPSYQPRAVESPSGEDIERAHKLLTELFFTFTFHLQTEHFSEGGDPIPPPLQQMRYSALTHNVLVRSPAYHDHWTELLRPLFSSKSVADWLADRHLAIGDVIECAESFGGLLNRRLVERVRKAKVEGEKLSKLFKEARRGVALPKDFPEVYREISKHNGKMRKQLIEGILTQWAFFALGMVWTITADDLAAEAGVPLASAKAFLEFFSIEFGNAPANDPWPRATHQLQSSPLIRFKGDSYFLAAPHLAIWSIKRNLEAVLKKTPGAPWQSYEANRANLVTRKGLEYLTKVMPSGISYEQLYYTSEGKQCELDGLFIFDRYILLIESKAGSVPDAALRGAPKSIESNLKDLVRDPSQQAARAKRFIETSSPPTFYTKSGGVVVIDPSKQYEVVTLALTLESLGVFTSDMESVKQLGLLPQDDISWTLYLPDLKIITEILHQPSQFWHYFQWRRRLAGVNDVLGKDEINWLGIYLKEGPSDVSCPPEQRFLTFSTYTTDLDDYFLYVMGQRSKAVRRPQQEIPAMMAQVIDAIEAEASHGYTAVTNHLLALTFSERKQFATLVRKQANNPTAVRSMETSDVSIAIINNGSDADSSEYARTLGEDPSKPTIILILRSNDTGRVSWRLVSASR
jgi:hypothetical protein